MVKNYIQLKIYVSLLSELHIMSMQIIINSNKLTESKELVNGMTGNKKNNKIMNNFKILLLHHVYLKAKSNNNNTVIYKVSSNT